MFARGTSMRLAQSAKVIEVLEEAIAWPRNQWSCEEMREATINQLARRLLVNAARHIIGGYRAGSPEDAAVELLLKLAERIPL